MTNDFSTVRADLTSSEAMEALGRIEAALRPFAEIAKHIAKDYEDGDQIFSFGTDDGWDCPLNAGDFRTAAARFAETAEGEGTQPRSEPDSPENADINGDGWGVP